MLLYAKQVRGSSYTFRVAAFSSHAAGQFSRESPLYPTDACPPAAPLHVAAVSDTPSALTVSWLPPPTLGNAELLRYAKPGACRAPDSSRAHALKVAALGMPWYDARSGADTSCKSGGSPRGMGCCRSAWPTPTSGHLSLRRRRPLLTSARSGGGCARRSAACGYHTVCGL